MNEIIATTGTEQMASTLIGISCIVIGMVIVLGYRRMQQYAWFKKMCDKIGLNSDFAKELLTDIKNESTGVAKKQAIRKVREEKITVLDDVNMDTIKKYEDKAQAASDKKLKGETDECDNGPDNKDGGGTIQDGSRGQS